MDRPAGEEVVAAAGVEVQVRVDDDVDAGEVEVLLAQLSSPSTRQKRRAGELEDRWASEEPTSLSATWNRAMAIPSGAVPYTRRSSETMADHDSRVTIHMAASLDGFIARRDGRVDWLETADEFAGGETMEKGLVEAFLETIDCYVMGSRTYETALRFEAEGLGWSYGDKPTFVLTRRELPRTRDSVAFYAGDLAQLVDGRLRPAFRTIWFVGGGAVSGECLRLGLADEIRYSILPILIGDGIPFFEKLDRDIALHLAEVKAYRSGMVELRYEVRGRRDEALRDVDPESDL